MDDLGFPYFGKPPYISSRIKENQLIGEKILTGNHLFSLIDGWLPVSSPLSQSTERIITPPYDKQLILLGLSANNHCPRRNTPVAEPRIFFNHLPSYKVMAESGSKSKNTKPSEGKLGISLIL